MLTAAAWLWAMPLAAAPVIVHLAFRLKRKPIKLPSLMFFHRLEPRLQARKRLRDFLVLLLRMLVITCAVLALAHPLWQGVGSGSAAVVLLIDNSASMAMPAPGGRSMQAVANEVAGSLIAAMNATDALAVVTTVADPDIPTSSECSTDRAAIRAVLDRIQPTHAPSAPGRALAQAVTLLQASTAPRREIHLITDAQTHDWGGAALDLPPLPAGISVVVHRLASEVITTNTALAELRLPERALIAGRPISLRAALTNPGSQTATAQLHIADDRGAGHVTTVTIPAGGRSDCPLAIAPATAGLHWARIWIDGDGFAGDDQGYVAFTCTERRAVWLAGSASWYGALPLALDPSGDGQWSGLQIATVPLQQCIAVGSAAKPPVLMLATWETLDQLSVEDNAKLRHWIENGGRLLAVPRADVAANVVRHLPEWCGVSVAETVSANQGVGLLAVDAGAPAWHDLIAADGSVALGRAQATQGIALRPIAGGRVVLGTERGQALLVDSTIGRGSVLISGLAFVRSWTDLPMNAAFLVLAQGLALPASNDDAAPMLVAGEIPRLNWPATTAVHLRVITGQASDRDSTVGTLVLPPRAGVYRIESADAARVISIRADPGEGAPERCVDAHLPALGTVPHIINDWHAGDDLAAEWRAQRTGTDLMPWLILLALAALAAEGWLANADLVRAQKPAVKPGMGRPS